MGEPAKDPRRLLDAKEVADLLGVSERWARDWIKRTAGRVVLGVGSRVIYKIPLRVVEQYMRKGGDQPWRGFTSEERPGGVGDTTPADDAGASPPTNETDEPRNVLRIESSSSWRIRPTTPGRSRSRRRSAT